MKLNKSIYGLLKSPLYWYNHLKGGFETRGFKLSPMDPWILYVRGIIVLIYVDDELFSGTDQDNIGEVIKELEDSGLSLTVKDNVHDLLGF